MNFNLYANGRNAAEWCRGGTDALALMHSITSDLMCPPPPHTTNTHTAALITLPCGLNVSGIGVYVFVSEMK